MEFRGEFINILEKLSSIDTSITDEQVKYFLEKLENMGFFEAPASTKYYNSYPGGLVEHSLNVYYNLKSLVERKHLTDLIPERSIIICGLLHDVAKSDYYVPAIRNKKVYSESGTKYDNLGRFDWVSEQTYQIKDSNERFVFGTLEETSEFIVSNSFELTFAESVALLHSKGNDKCNNNYSALAVYDKYPLAVLLYVADMISCYIDTK